MIETLRKFLKSSGGATVGIVVTVILVVIAANSLRSSFGQSETAAMANEKAFIDAESLKGFSYTPKRGDSIPIASPFTGKKTGYPAELCYWTKDGNPKNEPTYVLMQQALGRSGSTFCPDCGRLVRLFNPRAGPDVKPPPTKEEYASRKAPAGEE